MLKKVSEIFVIVVVICSLVPLPAQLKSQVSKPLPVEKAIRIPGIGSTKLGINFLDPNRFFMNQSYSLSYSSWGGRSASMGIYQNSMSYIFSDKLALRTRIGFMHDPLSMNTMTNQNNLMDNLIYGADLVYRPKKNMMFNIRFDKSPYYYRSRFYPYGYSFY